MLGERRYLLETWRINGANLYPKGRGDLPYGYRDSGFLAPAECDGILPHRKTRFMGHQLKELPARQETADLIYLLPLRLIWPSFAKITEIW
jgi:hypothetical protein